MHADFLLLEAPEDPDRTFVLHTVFPRFMMEFVVGGAGKFILSEEAPPAILAAYRVQAISFYEREKPRL